MLICILILTYFPVHAQNPVVDSLLRKIASCQQRYTDADYHAGLIPSMRIYRFIKKKYRRKDDNIFFTGLTVWTLRSHRDKLSEPNKILLDSICSEAVKNYPRYRHRRGDCTYNFWQTNPDRHFPNDPFFSSRKKYKLADDLDDTVVLYLSEEHSDSLKERLKGKMAVHANGSNNKIIRSTFRRYKHRKAYNTWFGEITPLEFDISVQCNAMLWVLNNKFELNEYDLETIRLIQDMVMANDHFKHPHYISPQYQSSAIILYHLARLISVHPDHFLRIRDKVIRDIQSEFAKTTKPMEKILLNTSLARFGLEQKEMPAISQKDFKGFYFFLADMTSVYPNPIKRWMAGSRVTNFYYVSEGYYWALLLENECMKIVK